MANVAPPASPTTLIQSTQGRVPLQLRELWRYRELFYFLTWRDLKVRYRQTVLGAGWAILQPVVAMVVFTVFFGRLAKIPSDGIPYPLFVFAALVPWTFFAQSVSRATASLVGGANLIRKVYFPRLVMPVSSMLSAAADFGIASLVLAGMMIYYRVAPTRALLVLPLLVLLTFATALGVGLWLSALNARYRDVGQMAPFLIQLWLFATPVVYPSSLISDTWRIVYGLNPMAGVIEGFRWALLGVDTAPGPMILVSAAFALVLVVTGAYYFRRTERVLADLI